MSTNDVQGIGDNPEQPPAETADADNRDRQRLMLLGAVGGAVAVAALGFFVVVPAFSGSNSSTPTSVAAPLVKPRATLTPSAKAKPTATSVPTAPASAVLVAGRDPFKPLLTEAPASSASVSPSASASSGTQATPTPTPSASGSPAIG